MPVTVRPPLTVTALPKTRRRVPSISLRPVRALFAPVLPASATLAVLPLSEIEALAAIVPICPPLNANKALPISVVLLTREFGAAVSTFSVASAGLAPLLPLMFTVPLPAKLPTVNDAGAERPPLYGPTVTVPVEASVSVPPTVADEPPSRESPSPSTSSSPVTVRSPATVTVLPLMTCNWPSISARPVSALLLAGFAASAIRALAPASSSVTFAAIVPI